MCNYENKNEDRKVLTQKNAARYGKEETVRIPAYYQMIGVNAFQSNIKMEEPVTAKRAAGNQHERVPVQQGAPGSSIATQYLPGGERLFCRVPFPSCRVSVEWPGRNFRGSVPGRPTAAKSPFTRDSEIKRIRKKAFYECTTLNTILLPPKVETIEDRAFYKCKELKKVRFPKGL